MPDEITITLCGAKYRALLLDRVEVGKVAAAVDLSEGKYVAALGELTQAKVPVPNLAPGPGSVTKNVLAGTSPFISAYTMSSKAGLTLVEKAKSIAQEVSGKTGIPASVLFEQMAYETGGFTSRLAKELGNLAGIKLPGGGSFASFGGDVEAFGARWAQILLSYEKRFGATPQARDEFVRMLQGGSMKYAPDRTASQYAAGMAHYGDIHITVNASTTASADEIARKIDAVLQESLRRPPKSESLQIQRNINEFSVPGWAQP